MFQQWCEFWQSRGCDPQLAIIVAFMAVFMGLYGFVTIGDAQTKRFSLCETVRWFLVGGLVSAGVILMCTAHGPGAVLTGIGLTGAGLLLPFLQKAKPRC